MARTRSPKSDSPRNYVEIGNRYARDVVAGKIPNCKWVRLACARHLEDLKKQKDRAFDFRFDAVAASKACRRIELLPHVKGEWARDARDRVDTWDLKRICGTNSQWTAEDQRKLLEELNTLPDGSMIVARLAPDWLRMRDGNRICRGEGVPTR